MKEKKKRKRKESKNNVHFDCFFPHLPLHSGHPVQFHVIATTETLCKWVVLDLQLGYL